jgi:hypothetical protein
MFYDGRFRIEFRSGKIRLILPEKDNEVLGLSAVNSALKFECLIRG